MSLKSSALNSIQRDLAKLKYNYVAYPFLKNISVASVALGIKTNLTNISERAPVQCHGSPLLQPFFPPVSLSATLALSQVHETRLASSYHRALVAAVSSTLLSSVPNPNKAFHLLNPYSSLKFHINFNCYLMKIFTPQIPPLYSHKHHVSFLCGNNIDAIHHFCSGCSSTACLPPGSPIGM